MFNIKNEENVSESWSFWLVTSMSWPEWSLGRDWKGTKV